VSARFSLSFLQLRDVLDDGCCATAGMVRDVVGPIVIGLRVYTLPGAGI
jgi:hypothetical protein